VPQSLVGDFRYFDPWGFGHRSLLAIFQFPFQRGGDRFANCIRRPWGGRRTFYGGVLFMRSVFELRDVSLFAKCSVALPVGEIFEPRLKHSALKKETFVPPLRFTN
jgi:hypothetical protein